MKTLVGTPDPEEPQQPSTPFSLTLPVNPPCGWVHLSGSSNAGTWTTYVNGVLYR